MFSLQMFKDLKGGGGERYFSIETDCSNVKNRKYLPILIRFFDPEMGGKQNLFTAAHAYVFMYLCFDHTVLS